MNEITSQEAVKVLQQKFLLEQGIVGISHGSDTLRVYVENETMARKIPSTLMGHDVEVIVAGKIRTLEILPKAATGRSLSGVTAGRSERWRPVPGGVSCGHYKITAGTLGALVYDVFTGRRMILSNNHVLANCNEAKNGDPITQPGPYDGGKDPEDRIAVLNRFISIKAPPVGNTVDAAIANPINEDDLSDEILDIGLVTSAESAVVGMKVAKSGRTSGYTEGIIQDIHASVKVAGYPWGETVFEDQIITTSIGQPGDSGSLVINADTKKAVGLLFAGSDTLTVVNKIENVMNSLGVSIKEVVPMEIPWFSVALGVMPLATVVGCIGLNEFERWRTQWHSI